MNQDKIIVGGNVQGDVTSCRIENQLKSIQKNSIFSIKQDKTYITYDVCNKQIISDYTVPSFTGFSVLLILFVCFIFCFIICAVADSRY